MIRELHALAGQSFPRRGTQSVDGMVVDGLGRRLRVSGRII
jgi:hypothetical protein